ncbi:hypothetical protein MMC22_004591 [Lobaria immixta]|nr:hypothetical protein [Lobaria immixta]
MFLRLFYSPVSLAFFAFMALYFVAIIYIHANTYRDPTSLFFDPRRAYVPAYSTVRQQEAEAFVVASTNPSTPLAGKQVDSFPNNSKKLCVGITSVARKGARCFRTTVGSLLEGLDPSEREEIYLLLLIVHEKTSNPLLSSVYSAEVAYFSSVVLYLRLFYTNRIILSACGVCIPLLIGLIFAAGKVTVLPLPAGVHEMNKYGCCSQGLVSPRGKVQDLIDWFETKKIGFVDMLTEEYADKHGEQRWALTPSVIQHIGRKSSKGDDFGAGSKYHMSVAEKLGNFAFEQNSATHLREEHSRVVKTKPQG